jgi:hypothetical protein
MSKLRLDSGPVTNSLFLSGARTAYESKVSIHETRTLPVAALGHSGGYKIVRSENVKQFAIKLFDSTRFECNDKKSRARCQ